MHGLLELDGRGGGGIKETSDGDPLRLFLQLCPWPARTHAAVQGHPGDALRCYLEPYFDNEDELFVDTEQLGGGDDLDRKIARAMCESVCMILIYTPKYEAHAYTRREYAAMRLLEAERGSGTLAQPPDHPGDHDPASRPLPPQISESSVLRRFFALHDGDRRPEIESGLPARHRQDGQAHRHPLPVPEKMYTPPGHDCNQFVLPDVPPDRGASCRNHLPEKMRSNMETNRITAAPAARPAR
jgi:hypothetical protein